MRGETQREDGAEERPRPARRASRRACRDEVARIGADYAAGRLLSGEVKARLVETLAPMVAEHQAARAAVTDDVVRHFMRVRPLAFTTPAEAAAARAARGDA